MAARPVSAARRLSPAPGADKGGRHPLFGGSGLSRRYSALSLFTEGLRGHSGWAPAWTSPKLKPAYDFVIVGGGGHGLATAYYLTKIHGAKSVARDRERLARRRQHRPQHGDDPLQLFLSRERRALRFRAARSTRGCRPNSTTTSCSRSAAFSPSPIPMRRWRSRRGWSTPCASTASTRICSRAEQALAKAPLLNVSDQARYPVFGGVWQGRAGVARHDAVAWGYARAASAAGVDIVQNCEVHGLRRSRAGAASASRPRKARCAPARSASRSPAIPACWRRKAGFDVPVRSLALQAMVSEPIKPCLDTVVLYPGTGTYVNQSDKGELVIGGGARPHALLCAARQSRRCRRR